MNCQKKDRNTRPLSMYPESSHLITALADVHRLSFQKLLELNNQLSAAVTLYAKRPRPDDSDIDAPAAST